MYDSILTQILYTFKHLPDQSLSPLIVNNFSNIHSLHECSQILTLHMLHYDVKFFVRPSHFLHEVLVFDYGGMVQVFRYPKFLKKIYHSLFR